MQLVTTFDTSKLDPSSSNDSVTNTEKEDNGQHENTMDEEVQNNIENKVDILGSCGTLAIDKIKNAEVTLNKMLASSPAVDDTLDENQEPISIVDKIEDLQLNMDNIQGSISTLGEPKDTQSTLDNMEAASDEILDTFSITDPKSNMFESQDSTAADKTEDFVSNVEETKSIQLSRDVIHNSNTPSTIDPQSNHNSKPADDNQDSLSTFYESSYSQLTENKIQQHLLSTKDKAKDQQPNKGGEIGDSIPTKEEIHYSKATKGEIQFLKSSLDELQDSLSTLNETKDPQPTMEVSKNSLTTMDEIHDSKDKQDGANECNSNATQDEIHYSNPIQDRIYDSNAALDDDGIHDTKTALEEIHDSNATFDRIHDSNAALDEINYSNPTLDGIHDSNATPDEIRDSNATPDESHDSNAVIDGIQDSNATPDEIHDLNAALDSIHDSNATLDGIHVSTSTLDEIHVSITTPDEIHDSNAALGGIQNLKASQDKINDSSTTPDGIHEIKDQLSNKDYIKDTELTQDKNKDSKLIEQKIYEPLSTKEVNQNPKSTKVDHDLEKLKDNDENCQVSDKSVKANKETQLLSIQEDLTAKNITEKLSETNDRIDSSMIETDKDITTAKDENATKVKPTTYETVEKNMEDLFQNTFEDFLIEKSVKKGGI